jgi:deoxycytidine triphosphate deaminase
MLLSDEQIKALIDKKESGLIIQPFDADRLQGASYDLQIGKRLLVSGDDHESDLSELGAVALMPGDFAVTVSNEYFEIPQNMVLNIGSKSYLTKKGIILQAGMQIDPGFKGHIIVGLYNSSPRKFVAEYRGDLCSVQFFQLQENAKKVFKDSPDHIRGEFPREMKDYLYSLETKSLTSLGEDVRALTKNVASMSEKISDTGNQLKSLRTIIMGVAIPLGLGLLLIIIQNILNK